MADLMRLSRPWLRAPIRPVQLSQLQILLSPRPLSRLASSHAKPPLRSAARKYLKNSTAQVEPVSNFLLPMTLVAPPLWRYPRQPNKFFHMLWLNIKARVIGLSGLISFKISSSPGGFFSRPQFRAQRSSAVPTAKALHVRMTEALAAGDRETLRAICKPELYGSLASVIDARPPGVRTIWELIRYEKTWYYPRLAEWRISLIPRPSGGTRTLKQAVVSIASVQRIARYDNSKGPGEAGKTKGGESVRHILEHIVLQAEIDDKTYQHGPWKIWGTVSESTYESYLEDIAYYNASVNAT